MFRSLSIYMALEVARCIQTSSCFHTDSKENNDGLYKKGMSNKMTMKKDYDEQKHKWRHGRHGFGGMVFTAGSFSCGFPQMFIQLFV